MSELFTMGGSISSNKKKILLQTAGWLFLFSLWFILAQFEIVKNTILPHPISMTYINGNGQEVTKGVYVAFVELFTKLNLPQNIAYSVTINLAGYVEATIAAIILGFLIGLIPLLKVTFLPQINAIRYIPLPSTTAIFMTMFGMGLIMKINFLAFGIFIYLLPTVIQRIEETDKVYLQTIKTLNANWWYKLTKVYFPSVLSRVAPDIIVLVAISWTYIVIIEVINNVGGLGGLIASNEKGRTDIVYAMLILIVTIGYVTDKLLKAAEMNTFKFKYA